MMSFYNLIGMMISNFTVFLYSMQSMFFVLDHNLLEYFVIWIILESRKKDWGFLLVNSDDGKSHSVYGYNQSIET